MQGEEVSVAKKKKIKMPIELGPSWHDVLNRPRTDEEMQEFNVSMIMSGRSEQLIAYLEACRMHRNNLKYMVEEYVKFN